jgi:beta-apo-4'-carotenal oxygenase
VKDEKAPDTEFMFKFNNPKIRKDPLRYVLVIGYVLKSR